MASCRSGTSGRTPSTASAPAGTCRCSARAPCWACRCCATGAWWAASPSGAPKPGGFNDDEVALVQSFAEQAVIAIASAEALRALQERTAALGRRNSEYGERIEQQSATIDVLKVMSASPGNAQPVFELITRRALEFCGASGARLVEVEGGLRHLRALVRVDGETEADAALRQLYPAEPDQHSIDGQVILHRRIVHTRSASETPPGMRGRYSASVLGMPLLRDGQAVGALTLSRAQPGGFNEAQVELLQTFAEQAVIAIGSAETLSRIARTHRGTGGTQQRIQRADRAAGGDDRCAEGDVGLAWRCAAGIPVDRGPRAHLLWRRAGDVGAARWRHAVSASASDADRVRRFLRGPVPAAGQFGDHVRPRHPDARRGTDRGCPVGPRTFFPHEDRRSAVRAIIAIPLLRAGKPVGAITLGRQEPGVFSATQMELLRTFAEQAVIAIGSAETYRDVAGAHRGTGAAQQPIRRTDRASVRHHRCAEGDVGLARRCAAGIRPDRPACTRTVRLAAAGLWNSTGHCSSARRHRVGPKRQPPNSPGSFLAHSA